jgi:hypothetical protein
MHWHPDLWLLRILGRFARRPVRNTLLYLVGVVAIAAAVYAIHEGQEITYIDGLWWAVVTLTTVGLRRHLAGLARHADGRRVGDGVRDPRRGRDHRRDRREDVRRRHRRRRPHAGHRRRLRRPLDDLADAVDRVRHLQERFRLDELGDDRLAAAAREVIAQFENGGVQSSAIGRLKDVLDRQHVTDA